MKQSCWACAHFPAEGLRADPLVYEYHTCFDHNLFHLQTWLNHYTSPFCLQDGRTSTQLRNYQLSFYKFGIGGTPPFLILKSRFGCFSLCLHWSLPLSGTDVLFLNQNHTSSCRLNRSRETPVSFTLPRPSRTFDYMFEYKRVLRQIIFISYRML